jgi:transcriptional regulator with XRE-family HTH domain
VNRLREVRFQKRLSQIRLALRVGISPSRISYFENELARPTKQQRVKLARALKEDLGLLFPEDEDEKSKVRRSSRA